MHKMLTNCAKSVHFFDRFLPSHILAVQTQSEGNMPVPVPYSSTIRAEALKKLATIRKNDAPDFSAVATETGISVGTLKKWWCAHVIEKTQSLASSVDKAIGAVIERIEAITADSTNLKELDPVLKTLADVRDKLSGSETENTW